MLNMKNLELYSGKFMSYLCRAEAAAKLPGAIQLDPLEQQFLTCLSKSWHSKNKITVLDAITSCSHMSASTAHRRTKRLRKMNLINLVTDEDDNRIKYIEPTPLIHLYFAKTWQCIKEVDEDRTR